VELIAKIKDFGVMDKVKGEIGVFSISFLSVNRFLYIPPAHPNWYFYPYFNKVRSSNMFVEKDMVC